MCVVSICVLYINTHICVCVSVCVSETIVICIEFHPQFVYLLYVWTVYDKSKIHVKCIKNVFSI